MDSLADAARVDVFVRTKNRPLFLKRALHSITLQTWPHIHVHVINDGGERDPVEQLIGSCPNSLSLTTHHISHSLGRAGALNYGLAHSTGDFVAIHDDDDSWNPHFVAALLRHYDVIARQIPRVGAVASLLRRTFETVVDNQVVYLRTVDARTHHEMRGILHVERYLRFEEDLFPIQLIFRRDLIDRVGRFDQTFVVAEDREFITRFIEKFEIAILTRPLAFHHVREASFDVAHSNSTADWERLVAFLHVIENRIARSKMASREQSRAIPNKALAPTGHMLEGSM